MNRFSLFFLIQNCHREYLINHITTHFFVRLKEIFLLLGQMNHAIVLHDFLSESRQFKKQLKTIFLDHMLKHDLKHMDGYIQIGAYTANIFTLTLLNYSDDSIDETYLEFTPSQNDQMSHFSIYWMSDAIHAQKEYAKAPFLKLSTDALNKMIHQNKNQLQHIFTVSYSENDHLLA
ncbi:MAG: hypothetical protein CMF41_02945 [Legionellales bacterium]|nr:hypothetical protein [Legionellales bacterium]